MAAKARGMKVGGFRGVLPTAEHHRMAAQAKKAAAARAADLASLNRDIREAGVTSLRAIARELNAREEIDANDPKRPLPPSAREPVFDFDLDWPACVTQIATHFFAHGEARLLGKRDQCLSGRAHTLLDRLEVCFEGRQNESMRFSGDLNVAETRTFEQ